jgi:hypothetical protein
MKNLFFVTLVITLILLVLPSCSPAAENDYGSDNSLLYETLLERYFNAYIKADLDTLLDCLDPDGPLYPEPEAIQNLRDSAAGSAVKGQADASDIDILDEGDGRARVKAEIFLSIDPNNNGEYVNQVSTFIFEFTVKNGKLRLFDATEEE